MTLLDDVLAKLDALPHDVRTELTLKAMQGTAGMMFVPNPGPQTEAYFCEADELYFGGEAAGGKTFLGIGLALTVHKKSLLLRRFIDDARSLVEKTVETIGHDKGLNRQLLHWRHPGPFIDFGGCQLETDKQRYKGDPHDLIFYDEAADFLESQIDFINIWNRSDDPKQRCRIIYGSNPPMTAEGFWLIKRFAAWLDPKHPHPAKPGEIRWYLRRDDREEDVDGPGPYDVNGEMIRATSRTFIRSRLEDNPDYAKGSYKDRLHLAPPELRAAYREGKFESGLTDHPRQVIPTAWIVAAQNRWKPTPPQGIPMVSMGVDSSGGGKDPLILARRYDWWFHELIVIPGRDLPPEKMGKFSAGTVVSYRKDSALIILDMGGGYGGPAYEHLKDNGVDVLPFKGSEGSTARTNDRQLGFYNKRSETIWKFREALDPDQQGGSPIALPPDQELLADLAAPTFDVGPRGIQVEPKEDLVKRLGRSTDKGDAVVMAWSGGPNVLAGHRIPSRVTRPEYITKRTLRNRGHRR